MIHDVYFRHGLRASMLPRETAMHKRPEFHAVQVYRSSAKSSAGACVLNCRVWNGALTIHPNNEDTHPARSEGRRVPCPCTSRKCAGPKPAPTGEQGTGMLCPREKTSEKRMWCGAIWMWKYTSLSPRTQPVPGTNLHQDLFQQNRPERIGQSPPSILCTTK